MILRLSLIKDKELIIYSARIIFQILNNIMRIIFPTSCTCNMWKNERRVEAFTTADFLLKELLAYFQLLYYLNMLPDGGSLLLDQHVPDPHIK